MAGRSTAKQHFLATCAGSGGLDHIAMLKRVTVRLNAVLAAASRLLWRSDLSAFDAKSAAALYFPDSRGGIVESDEYASMTISPPGIRATAMLAACLPLLMGCGGAKIEAAPRADPRTPIQLSADEAEHLRSGMRVYLESIQGVVEALHRNKMAVVASNAKRAGMGMVNDIPVSVVIKLPPEFVILSIDTHQKFDALSRVAAASGTKSAVLAHLQEILANCTACHSTYRTSPDRR